MEHIGHYDSPDGMTSIDWALPEYSDLDRRACAIGIHVKSRKVVVTGWVGLFSQVKRAYCACGRRCWIWYEHGWASQDNTEPGGHLHWIETFTRAQAQFARHREWEQAMSDQHPCWGGYRQCISCGCSETQPCVSHVGHSQPIFTPARREAMAAAYERQEHLRTELWP